MDDSASSRPESATMIGGLLYALSGLCAVLAVAATTIPASEEPGAGIVWNIVLVPVAAAAALAVMAVGVLRRQDWARSGTIVTLGVIVAFPYDMSVSSLAGRVFGQGSFYDSFPIILILVFLIVVAMVGVVAMLVSSGSFAAWFDTNAPARGRPSAALVAVAGGGLLVANGLPLMAIASTPEPTYTSAATTFAMWSAPVVLLVFVALPAIIGLARGRERGRVFAVLACAVTIADLAMSTLTSPRVYGFGYAHLAGLLIVIPVLIVLIRAEVGATRTRPEDAASAATTDE